MANKLRSEYTVKLDGKSYKARPTFDAICNFEDEAGTTCLELCQTLMKGKAPKTRQIVASVWAGINGAGADMQLEEVAELVLNDGIYNHINSVVSFVHSAVAADTIPEGKESAGGGEEPPK